MGGLSFLPFTGELPGCRHLLVEPPGPVSNWNASERLAGPPTPSWSLFVIADYGLAANSKPLRDDWGKICNAAPTLSVLFNLEWRGDDHRSV